MASLSVKVPFPSSSLADIAKQALEPDSEVKPTEVQKTFRVLDDDLYIDFTCISVRMARVALQSFLDNLEVVVRTMHELQHL